MVCLSWPLPRTLRALPLNLGDDQSGVGAQASLTQAVR